MSQEFNKPIYRLAPSSDLLVDAETDVFTGIFSDESVGRDNHIVVNRGIQYTNFMRDPVIPFAHDDSQPPVGRATRIDLGDNECRIAWKFVPREISPFAGMIRDLVAGGWLRALSMSWQPLEWKFTTDRKRPGGVDFLKVDLLEVSIVPIPALPTALIDARSRGIDTRPMYEWAERLLDTGGMTLVPRLELETLRRAAKMPQRAQSAEWKVGASRDLPIEDSDSWDGPAAEKSIFEWAGGDKFESAKARKGFLAYDASKPEERGSYKLPIALVSDGELKVPKGAIRAAASRLPDTDIPDDVKKKAGAVLDHYKEKAGIGEKDEDEKKRALRTKHARAIARAPRVPLFRRGLCEVAQLAWALHGLGYLHDCTEYEADVEGDDSKVPEMLGEALKALGESLIAMTQEEVAELLEEVAGEGDDDAGDAGSEVPLEERAFVAAAATSRARSWRRGIAIARAGKVLSASNESRLKEAQDHHQRALKHHKDLGEHHEAVSGHVEKLRSIHERTTSTLAELGYDHHRVNRAMDDMSDRIDSLADSHGDVGDAHHSAERSVKAAQRCVRSVVASSQTEPDAETDAENQKDKDPKDKERAIRARRAKALQLTSS